MCNSAILDIRQLRYFINYCFVFIAQKKSIKNKQIFSLYVTHKVKEQKLESTIHRNLKRAQKLTYFCWSIGTSEAASKGGGCSSAPELSTAASCALTSSQTATVAAALGFCTATFCSNHNINQLARLLSHLTVNYF